MPPVAWFQGSGDPGVEGCQDASVGDRQIEQVCVGDLPGPVMCLVSARVGQRGAVRQEAGVGQQTELLQHGYRFRDGDLATVGVTDDGGVDQGPDQG